MTDEKKNQYIIITIIGILLAVIVCLAILFIINYVKNNKNNLNVKINQIYSSDYNLEFMGDYFIGSYEDNTINVIINRNGEEIYKRDNSVYYDNIFKLKDSNYLIYNTLDNNLNVYIFDGNNIDLLYSVSGISNVKPLIFKNYYQEYIVGFVRVDKNTTYIYNVYDSNVVSVKDGLLVADSIAEDKYYVYSDKYLVIKNDNNLMGAINYNGTNVIPYEYKNLLNTYNESFIAQNNKGYYGIISSKNEKIIDFSYKAISLYENNYLLVNKKDMMALYDIDYKALGSFKMNYNTLLDFDLRSNMNSINLYKSGGRYFVINNYLEDENKTEYKNHDLYIINNNGELIDTIKQIGFGVNDLIYIYTSDYKINIYDSDFNLLCEIELSDATKIKSIVYVSNKIIKISYINNKDKIVNKYYNTDGKEERFGFGDLVLRNTLYLAYMRSSNDNKSLVILDNDDNELDSIDGTKMEINDNYLIVDNSIYEIVKKEN